MIWMWLKVYNRVIKVSFNVYGPYNYFFVGQTNIRLLYKILASILYHLHGVWNRIFF